MDRKPNVHVIMLDSFTHSPFAEEFMGVENPAADYLATLDDTIYAGGMGFVENVATPTFLGDVVQSGAVVPQSRFLLGYGAQPLDRIAAEKRLQYFHRVFQQLFRF